MRKKKNYMAEESKAMLGKEQSLLSLDLGCLSKAHVLKAWSSAWYYGKMMEPLRGWA
jgi:hypothetical protein